MQNPCHELLVQDIEGTDSVCWHRLPSLCPNLVLNWDYCWALLLSLSFQLCQYRVHARSSVFQPKCLSKNHHASDLFIIPPLVIWHQCRVKILKQLCVYIFEWPGVAKGSKTCISFEHETWRRHPAWEKGEEYKTIIKALEEPWGQTDKICCRVSSAACK